MNNREKLCVLGEALHGPRWMRALARDLGVDYRQVNRWANGEYEPSDGVIADVLAIAGERRAALDVAIALGEARTAAKASAALR